MRRMRPAAILATVPAKRAVIVALLAFLTGAAMIVADEVFFWYGALGRSYYYWPQGIVTDVWTAWELCWAVIALCFGGMTYLALTRPSARSPAADTDSAGSGSAR